MAWCWCNQVLNLGDQTVTFNFADNGSSKSVLQNTAMQKRLTLVALIRMAFALNSKCDIYFHRQCLIQPGFYNTRNDSLVALVTLVWPPLMIHQVF